jgi:hypothetical protein
VDRHPLLAHPWPHRPAELPTDPWANHQLNALGKDPLAGTFPGDFLGAGVVNWRPGRAVPIAPALTADTNAPFIGKDGSLATAGPAALRPPSRTAALPADEGASDVHWEPCRPARSAEHRPASAPARSWQAILVSARDWA